MSKVFQDNCPLCGTRSVAFTILYEKNYDGFQLHWDTFAQCGYCHRGIIATFRTINNQKPSTSTEKQRELLEIAPPPPYTAAPKHTPPNAARFFKQAMDNLPNNWDAAGTMFRKALEAGLKRKFPEMKGTLRDRIKKAAKEQKLTPELAEWAHQIRLGGNDAAHEEDPFSEKEAKDLRTFTDLVFQYLFLLPGMLNEARGDSDAVEVSEGPSGSKIQ